MLFLAYQSPVNRLHFLAGAVFFGLMGYFSIRNAGNNDSPFVWWAIGLVFLFYSLIGIMDDAYPWRGYTISLEHEPGLYWMICAATLSTGIAIIAYGISRRKKQ